MKYFTMSELTNSSTARQLHINNEPDAEARANLIALVDNVLDKARSAWGRSIVVTSGYRSPRLNKVVGGVRNSQHMTGEAADITTGSIEGNRWLFEYIRKNLPYDQLIDESNYSWIHVSYRPEGGNRQQILRL